MLNPGVVAGEVLVANEVDGENGEGVKGGCLSQGLHGQSSSMITIAGVLSQGLQVPSLSIRLARRQEIVAASKAHELLAASWVRCPLWPIAFSLKKQRTYKFSLLQFWRPADMRPLEHQHAVSFINRC